MCKKNIRDVVVMANFIAAGILFMLLLSMVRIPLIQPNDSLVTDERKPEFYWGGLHGVYNITIDDDSYFRTPLTKTVSGNSYVPENDLDFQTYYWRVESNGLRSETRRFSVVSKVALERKRDGVKNVGNVMILLGRITGLMTLGVGETVKVNEDENVKAEQV